MFKRFFKDELNVPLQGQIDRILDEMQSTETDSEEYERLMTYLERLEKLKAEERREPVSLDTVAIVAGNLLGILVIVAYEQKHVMTSKGFTQLIKTR